MLLVLLSNSARTGVTCVFIKTTIRSVGCVSMCFRLSSVTGASDSVKFFRFGTCAKFSNPVSSTGEFLNVTSVRFVRPASAETSVAGNP